MKTKHARRRLARGLLSLAGATGLLSASVILRADDRPNQPDRAAQGRELFVREWVPADGRSHGGDGLGPAYNDSSCVACHNMGGVGGGGPGSKNVDILSAVPGPQNQFVVAAEPMHPREPGFFERSFQALLGMEEAPLPPVVPATPPRPASAAPRVDRSQLVAMHPGFRAANSVVLHRYATDANYEAWRSQMTGMGFPTPGVGGSNEQRAALEIESARVQVINRNSQNQFQMPVGTFFVSRSQRNPTSLFGAGLLDQVKDSDLVELAARKHDDFPEIQGRVSRLKDGRIGKFGWKAQTPSLEDFVLTACAVELGLEVPGHAQGGLPQKPDRKGTGLDLNADECNLLTEYVRLLPKPVQVNEANASVKSGRELFASVGCAACHTQKLGAVDGVYSDLLLHDMGQDLGDVGQYSVFDPSSSEEIPIEPESAVSGPLAATTPAGNELGQVGEVAQAAPAVAAGEAQASPVLDQTPQAAAPAGPLSMGGLFRPSRPSSGPANRQEWRTPPLWGLRDSAPYMHDGRAATLEQAIALHDGEAARVAHSYFLLEPEQRADLLAFLRSLASPDTQAETVAQARP